MIKKLFLFFSLCILSTFSFSQGYSFMVNNAAKTGLIVRTIAVADTAATVDTFKLELRKDLLLRKLVSSFDYGDPTTSTNNILYADATGIVKGTKKSNFTWAYSNVPGLSTDLNDRYTKAQSDVLYPLKDGTGATGTWVVDISGNSATTTNGVVTTGSYSNPSWITALPNSKITGLGTAALKDITYFATAAQGALASTALQSYTETDPTVPSYSKTLNAFSVIKTSTDILYPSISTTINGHTLSSNVTVTATDINLGSVDNTSDINKPVSTAQAASIASKLTIPSGTTSQYVDGTGALQTSKTTLSQFTNNLGYGTAAYLDSIILKASIAVKFTTPTGTTSQVVLGNGTLGTLPVISTRSFNDTPSHTIVTTAAAANGFQVSSTRDADIRYSVTIVSTATISGNASGYVVLEKSVTNSNNAADWQEVARMPNGQAVSLALTLQSVSTGGGQIGCILQAGYYARLRSVNVAGTPTYTYNSGSETKL